MAPAVRPPSGAIEPTSATLGSVVTRPSGSSAQSSGIGSPALAASTTLPRATVDTDRSITSGGRFSPSGPSARGQAKAIGLVPYSAVAPPQGAIAAGVLEKASAISPRLAASSTWWPATPKWWLCLMPMATIPVSPTMPAAASRPSRIAGNAKPIRESTSSTAAAVRVTVGSAKPSTLPFIACSA